MKGDAVNGYFDEAAFLETHRNWNMNEFKSVKKFGCKNEMDLILLLKFICFRKSVKS